MEDATISNPVQLSSGTELTPGGRDPVLALLADISANLKELNSTLKDHSTRLARLEIQPPSSESSPEDQKVEEASVKEVEISETHCTEEDPDNIRYAAK
jgi:hypothetical protein